MDEFQKATLEAHGVTVSPMPVRYRHIDKTVVHLPSTWTTEGFREREIIQKLTIWEKVTPLKKAVVYVIDLNHAVVQSTGFDGHEEVFHLRLEGCHEKSGLTLRWGHRQVDLFRLAGQCPAWETKVGDATLKLAWATDGFHGTLSLKEQVWSAHETTPQAVVDALQAQIEDEFGFGPATNEATFHWKGITDSEPLTFTQTPSGWEHRSKTLRLDVCHDGKGGYVATMHDPLRAQEKGRSPQAALDALWGAYYKAVVNPRG